MGKRKLTSRQRTSLAVFKKQNDKLQADISKALQPVFKKQVKDFRENLTSLSEDDAKNLTASNLANLAVGQDKKKTKESIQNAIVPIMAVAMLKSLKSVYVEQGIDPR